MDLMLSFAFTLAAAILSAILGYFLGVKQTKRQAISKYITEIAGKIYPDLFSEIREQLERLNNFLEEPNGNFTWRVLDDIYDSGLDRFVQKHHEKLFHEIDSFHVNIVPKFFELDSLFMEIWEKTFPIWTKFLRTVLPEKVKNESNNIAHDLSKSITPYYVLPDLLNERYESAKNKIVDCIKYRTTHIFKEPTDIIKISVRSELGLEKEPIKYPNFANIAQPLIEKINPLTTNLIQKHKELTKLTKNEIKLKLLPLLRECISNPI